MSRSRLSLNFALSLCAIGALARFGPGSFDVWWQMADARWILSHHAFPAHNEFAYTLTAAPTICHEWLTGVLFYLIYGWFSARGLAVLCAAAFGLFVALFYETLPGKGARPWTAWLYGLLFLCLARLRYPCRPELFSNFLMLAVCALERRERPSPWAYLGVFALWANLHGQYVCGLLYLLVGLAAEPGRPRAARLLAAGAGVLCNPYGWRILEVPLRFFLHQRYEFGVLMEGRLDPLLSGLTLAVLAATVGALLLSARAKLEGNRRALARDLALALILGWQTVRLNRLFATFLIVALPILYERGLRLLAHWPTREPRHERVLAWAPALIVLLLRAPGLAAAWRQPLDPRAVPARAADFMERIGARGKVFNSFDIGGYLQWRLYPFIRTFCDNRSLGSTPLIYEMWDARQAPERWASFMDRYDADFAFIDWVWEGGLVPVPLGPAWRHDPALSPYHELFPRSRWALIYWDQTALVFARVKPGNAELIRRYELKLTEPLSWEATRRLLAEGRVRSTAVLAELDAVENRSGRQWVAELMRRQLSARVQSSP